MEPLQLLGMYKTILIKSIFDGSRVMITLFLQMAYCVGVDSC